MLPVTLVGALLCGASASGVTITVGAALVDRHGPAGPAAVTEANALAAATGLVGPLLVGAFRAPRLRLAPGRADRDRLLVALFVRAAVALGTGPRRATDDRDDPPAAGTTPAATGRA